ncbi:transposable element Tcb2 transposase [Trichonephila clavipes]|nr:transposable element Tcb2 transposase [Trichonephila clavipes]
MINSRTRLHVVANGTMTGQRYIDEVLLPHDCLDSEGIQRLVWPARSPDLNPIENVWDALGRQVAGRNYPKTNKNTLIRALTEEWDKLPQQLLDNVVKTDKSKASRRLEPADMKITEARCRYVLDINSFLRYTKVVSFYYQLLGSPEVGGTGREVGGPDPLGILPPNWFGSQLNRTVSCMGLKAMALTGVHVDACHDELRRPGSDADEIRL